MSIIHPSSDANRAQSETLGVALLLGIAVLGAVTVVATGFSALDQNRERAGFDQAERSLTEFDSKTSEVALGRSESARIDFGLPDSEGTMSVRPNEGWMRVRILDTETGDLPRAEAGPPPAGAGAAMPPGEGAGPPPDAEAAPPSGGGGAPSSPYPHEINVTLGAVVYEQGARTVSYQSGGVFRSDGNSSVLVSRPEFHYRSGTLTIPIVKTSGDVPVASEIQAKSNGSIRKFPVDSQNLTNEVDATVIVTVRSNYYAAWGDFFREQTPGTVTIDHQSETATVRFEEGSGSSLEFMHITVHRMTVS